MSYPTENDLKIYEEATQSNTILDDINQSYNETVKPTVEGIEIEKLKKENKGILTDVERAIERERVIAEEEINSLKAYIYSLQHEKDEIEKEFIQMSIELSEIKQKYNAAKTFITEVL